MRELRCEWRDLKCRKIGTVHTLTMIQRQEREKGDVERHPGGTTGKDEGQDGVTTRTDGRSNTP
jgi:hypothetical protein